MKKTDSHLTLAKQAIEAFVKTGQNLVLPSLPEKAFNKKAGVFVSVHTKDGKLRGCIGTFQPTKKNLAEEIIANAIAATQDPRFLPLAEKELNNLTYKVDILSGLKSAKKENLDPKKYGLLVSSQDGRRGLLLPDIPGVNTVTEQISICKQKAGIRENEKVKLRKFTVERHE